MPIESRTRAWVEIDLDALRANFQVVRQLAGAERGVLPMVKANAYGLGVEHIVGALEREDPWGYGVATVEEGVALRDLGIERPVLVVTPIPPAAEGHAIAARLTPSISDLASLARLRAAAETHGSDGVDVHVEIDTGMGRSGFDWRQAAGWAPSLADAAGKRVRIVGVFTHFHSADEPDGESPTLEQAARFAEALEHLPIDRAHLVVHTANSAASLRWPHLSGDFVRPGIFLYGGHAAPSIADEDVVPAPRTVASIRARLSLVREMPAGSTAGYGATYAAVRAERWATAAIGYGDGLPRAYGNRGWALVRGQRVPVRGRVSMDSVVLDVSDVPEVTAGDVATFVGADGDAHITLDEAAALAGTISYEILTRMGNRLPRVYGGEGER